MGWSGTSRRASRPTLTTPACEQAVRTVVPRPSDVGGQEALVVDLEVEGHLSVAPGVVSGETGLIARATRDVAAGEEQASDRVLVGVGDDLSSGGLDGVDGGFGREHREHVERGEDPALVGSVRVHVHDQRRTSGAASCGGDRFDDRRDASRVVPVPVRQEQHVDGGQVDGEALGVGEPHVAVGADIEEDRRGPVACSGLREGGEPVAGDAEVVEGDDAVVPVVLAHRLSAEEVGHLGELRDARADARERVGGVVDDDRDGERIELGRRRVGGGCHRLMVPEPAPTGSSVRSGSKSSRTGAAVGSVTWVVDGASWSPKR